MKMYRIFLGTACLLLCFAIACKKDHSKDGQTPSVPPVTDTSLVSTPPPDTSHNTPPDTSHNTPPLVSIAIKNPGFEDSIHYWKIATAYYGKNGFKPRSFAARTGNLGLNFYAAQPSHFQNAPQETPWNGKIYQTVKGLTDGWYRFAIYADAVGDGMYLWADGGTGEVKTPIKSDESELNTLDFEVKGGIAKFGFICINAGGTQTYAPYFHADDAELLKK